MSLIKVENLSMSYEGNRVVDNLSFSVENGDYLCIIGENGSGKTTLLKGLLGLKKIDSGKIIFSNTLSRSLIGYLPQQSDYQKDFPASVKEVVLSGTLGKKKFHPFYTASDKKSAADAMKKLEIDDISSKCYHDLSGGQQQRVLLARAICASDKLIILDEPVTGLDMAAGDEMYKVISKLNRSGVTVVMISHDINRVLAYAKHILHIRDSKMLFYGSAKEYKEKISSGAVWE